MVDGEGQVKHRSQPPGDGQVQDRFDRAGVPWLGVMTLNDVQKYLIALPHSDGKLAGGFPTVTIDGVQPQDMGGNPQRFALLSPDAKLPPRLDQPNRQVPPDAKGMPADAPARLSAEQISGMTTDQLKSLTPASIAQMTPDQLQGLSPDQLRTFNFEQLRGFTPDQLRAFSPDQLKGFSPEQLKMLTPEQKNDLRFDQLKALTKDQRQAIFGEAPGTPLLDGKVGLDRPHRVGKPGGRRQRGGKKRRRRGRRAKARGRKARKPHRSRRGSSRHSRAARSKHSGFKAHMRSFIEQMHQK